MGVEHGDKRGGSMNVYGCDVFRSGALAPCPFCDNDVTFVKYNDGLIIKCPVCDCMMARQISISSKVIVPFKDEEQGAKAWNNRLGVTEHGRAFSGSVAPRILSLREQRVRKIVDCIKRRKGEIVHAKEIASDVGLTDRQVSNLMHYIKRKYPEVQNIEGKLGYTWKEN